MLAGDILLIRGKELHRANRDWLRWLISWVISKLTGSEYTHSALYDGIYVYEVDIFKRVSLAPLSTYSYYDVYRKENATDKDRMNAVLFCCSKFGCKYDYTAVLAIALDKLFGIGWNPNDPDRWFCSELDAAAWGIEHESRITPGDLPKYFTKVS